MISLGQLLEIDDSHISSSHTYSDNNSNTTIPWIEKYRPSTLNDVVYQFEVVKMLKEVLNNGNLPHLLFHGPAGSGKTSCILAIAMELFGPKRFKDRVIELNASDERGINIVRNKIVTFAKSSIGTADPGYPSPPYKIIILDEADAMTTEAQSALRKTMENNSNITRFCFICNYINQIIEPIASRCVKFRFKPINEKCIVDKLKLIAHNENVNISDDAVSHIASLSEGDLRKSIMYLQNLKYIGHPKNIVKEDVLQITGHLDNESVSLLKLLCSHTDDKSHLSTNVIIKIAKNIKYNGYPIHIVIRDINGLIIKNNHIDDKMKSLICSHIATIEKRLIDGADEYLQLLSALLYINCITNNINTAY